MPVMTRKILSPQDLQFCNKMISSDALAALVLDGLARPGTAFSVVRMSDGERAVLHSCDKAPLPWFLKDPGWLKEYGLLGIDLETVRVGLERTAQQASVLCGTVSGLYMHDFKVHDIACIAAAPRYGDVFYPAFWTTTGRDAEILHGSRVLLLHRNCDRLAPLLYSKYQLSKVVGYPLSNPTLQAEDILSVAKEYGPELILVSGGPSGKVLTVDLAQQCGCVALDVGCAVNRWVD